MERSPQSSAGFSLRNVLMIIVPVAIFSAVGVWYYSLQAQQQAAPQGNRLRNFLRLNLMAPSTLDDGLTDEDGDLVAGSPKKVEQQIDPETLVFAILGQEPKEAEDYADLAKHLEKATGKKVEVKPWDSSIPSQMQDLRDGTLHIAALSTGTVSTGVNKGGFVPFCVMADAKGDFGFKMEIIVPASSSAKTVADLKGKKISFVSPYSHSGFKAPVVILWKEFNLQPGVDYDPSIEGDQESVIRGVAEGKVMAGAVASDYLQRKISEGKVDPKAVRVLYTSPTQFPPACFGHAHQLKPELAKKIREGFLGFDWKGSKLESAFAAAGQSKFVPISYKTDWASVRDIEQQAGHLVEAAEPKQAKK